MQRVGFRFVALDCHERDVLGLNLFHQGIHCQRRTFEHRHTEAVHVDAMSLYMLQNPADYDVLVMEKMFGDILSRYLIAP